jgi:hypothetical protein
LETAEKKLADLESQLKTGVMPSVNAPVLKQIGEERQTIANIKARTEAAKELNEWERQAAEFDKKGDEAELTAIEKICNSSGGRKRTITETSKNLHVRPGVWLKNLAVYMFEGRKGQTSLVARGKAAAIGTAATGT